ncbi:polyprotein [Plakobranchus ocellatus]|uniref:Polyprotein n=1 Tax=Plakobranchus ocellatus TaxID=259542 RepID=A0AAV3Y1K3_9GAST|nr:polyprotein [Plakobranchus ocellatus]
MIIDEIRNKEDSTRVQKAVQQPQQGQWTNWDTAIQRSLTWSDIWHMAPLRISFLIRLKFTLLLLLNLIPVEIDAFLPARQQRIDTHSKEINIKIIKPIPQFTDEVIFCLESHAS